MMKRMMLAMALAGCCVSMATAQMGGGAAPAGMVSPAKSFDSLLSLYEGEALGVAKAMPADKYDFAPSTAIFKEGQGAKFDGVRTFADQVKHVTQANYFFYGTAAGLKPDVDVKAIGALKDKDQIVAAFAASFVFAHKAIAMITPQNAFDGVKGEPDNATRMSMVAFGVAHGYDHYGQMVEYLRMNGGVPPGSK